MSFDPEELGSNISFDFGAADFDAADIAAASEEIGDDADLAFAPDDK